MMAASEVDKAFGSKSGPTMCHADKSTENFKFWLIQFKMLLLHFLHILTKSIFLRGV